MEQDSCSELGSQKLLALPRSIAWLAPAVEPLGGKGNFQAVPKRVTFISPALGGLLFAALGARAWPPPTSGMHMPAGMNLESCSSW